MLPILNKQLKLMRDVKPNLQKTNFFDNIGQQ